ncbi:ChbG/HpnK family deacetylase [Allokutzneria sp. A3M-2-11 16]|uniref:ChbG/HpnK family deacetylase n=1 Tax=Allokutzneria sp. A3M-2-11 16 TaxID=2962043 RepID=UPI0020B786C7|nr:ChbG/HpnK family deacetylase [Allokutzneria sp. A3M-2-11 16]MCP3801311.1 ChbG/HpnK family deacetylase [Allokutzneria sp. A3M-2-11 16]
MVRSSELLGYPADARLLIVNCDDFGLHEEVNTAVIESIERGIASSCSLMTPCPGAPGAMALLRERPEIPFGVHLSLVRDSVHEQWGPLAPRRAVPSLLDETGELFTSEPAGRAALLARARIDEVEVEFRHQINAVAAAGLAPTHLDFHCLADGGREDVFDLTAALAVEHGLALRVWLEPGRRKARHRGLPVTDNDFLDSFSLELQGKEARYARLLRELPAGLTEWAVHPSTGAERSRAVDPGWRVRRTDYEFLTSREAGDVLRHEGVVVIDYRALQEVWSSGRQE